MPSALSRSIHAAANAVLATSENTVPVAGGGAYETPCSAFRRKTAICDRFTGEFGQKFPPPQPAVMPSVETVKMESWNGLISGTSKNSPGGVYTRTNALNSGPVGAGVDAPTGVAGVMAVMGIDSG